MEFLIMVDIFSILEIIVKTDFKNIFSSWKLLSRQISKTKSTNQRDFFAYRVIYFWDKLPNQIKKTAKV